jgi:P27 family predicted phage terminase small subunit
MPRGGKTKPVLIHKLQGTYQPVRHARRAHEPKAPDDLTKLPPPAWMTKAQKERWKDILRRAPKGVLADIDQEQFTAYVVHVDTFVEAAKAQAGKPLINEKGVVAPLLRLMRQTTEVMVRIQSEFGFTPVGRTRLGMPAGGAGDDPEPGSPHQRFDTVLPDGKVLPYAGRK